MIGSHACHRFDCGRAGAGENEWHIRYARRLSEEEIRVAAKVTRIADGRNAEGARVLSAKDRLGRDAVPNIHECARQQQVLAQTTHIACCTGTLSRARVHGREEEIRQSASCQAPQILDGNSRLQRHGYPAKVMTPENATAMASGSRGPKRSTRRRAARERADWPHQCGERRCRAHGSPGAIAQESRL